VNYFFSFSSLSLLNRPLNLPKMDFLFLRDPTVPNLEGELLVEEDGESVSDVGNACCAPFAGVAGALGAGVATGVDMGVPLVAGFSDSATGVASARAVSAGA